MTDSKGAKGHSLLLVAALALGLLGNPASAYSQVVRGRLMESTSRLPIQSANIILLDTAFVAVAGTVSNPTGAFLLEAPGPGQYYVLAEALGYSPSVDGILEIEEGGSITVEFFLKPKPLVLDSLLVAVERAQIFQHLESAGFNERLLTGFGHFVTPDEIKRRNPRYFTDLFRTSPGVRVQGSALDGTIVQFQSSQGGLCNPTVFVDGTRVPMDANMGGLEAVVDINQIAAAEVYTRATTVPLQYSGTGNICGVLLIWTR